MGTPTFHYCMVVVGKEVCFNVFMSWISSVDSILLPFGGGHECVELLVSLLARSTPSIEYQHTLVNCWHASKKSHFPTKAQKLVSFHFKRKTNGEVCIFSSPDFLVHTIVVKLFWIPSIKVSLNQSVFDLWVFCSCVCYKVHYTKIN